MDLVVDANILVGELLRTRGRELLRREEFKLYVAEKALNETRYELTRRLTIMKNQGKLTQSTEKNLLEAATDIIKILIIPVALSSYAHLEAEAKKRIPRDINDWETIALALFLSAAIWTEDYDFFGCGCPTWTTETLLLQL